MRGGLSRRNRKLLFLAFLTGYGALKLAVELAVRAVEQEEALKALQARSARLAVAMGADVRHIENELVVAGVFERVEEDTGLPPTTKAKSPTPLAIDRAMEELRRQGLAD